MSRDIRKPVWLDGWELEFLRKVVLREQEVQRAAVKYETGIFKQSCENFAVMCERIVSAIDEAEENDG